MQILKHTPMDKGSLIGMVNAKTPIQLFLNGKWENGTLTMNEIKIFKNKDGKKFISLPSRPYEVNGEKKFFSINYLDDKKLLKQFEDTLLQAIADHKSLPTQNNNEDVPF